MKEPTRITIEHLTDFYKTLDEWESEIQSLIKKYGRNAKLGTDAGHNNVVIFIDSFGSQIKQDYKFIKRKKQ